MGKPKRRYRSLPLNEVLCSIPFMIRCGDVHYIMSSVVGDAGIGASQGCIYTDVLQRGCCLPFCPPPSGGALDCVVGSHFSG